MKSIPGSFALVAAGLFVLPIIAKAQATEGAFVNGSLGSASFDFGVIDGNDTSYGVNAGYRWAVSPGALIGIEAGYIDLGSYSALTSISTTTLASLDGPPAVTTVSPARATTELSGWTIGANGRFSLSPNWHLGGRAGYFRTSLDSVVRTIEPDDPILEFRSDVNAEGWYAGAGFGYDFSNNFSVGLNYDYYSAKKYGTKFNSNVISVSGEYRF